LKAKIIGQKVSLSLMDFVHGGGHYMYRFYVPDAKNLVFGVAEDKVFAFTGYDFEKNRPDVLAEVDLADDLVLKAFRLAMSKDELQHEASRIEELLLRLQRP